MNVIAMNNQPIITTPRLEFHCWTPEMRDYARQLWGNTEVTRYIAAKGKFSATQIQERLSQELSNWQKYRLQYWMTFTTNKHFIGCCGLRPRDISSGIAEIGCHLLPEYWGLGYANEALIAVINYAHKCGFIKLFAGHNPHNHASQKMLQKLGFRYIGNEYYPPTGLNHPSYELDLQQK